MENKSGVNDEKKPILVIRKEFPWRDLRLIGRANILLGHYEDVEQPF